MNRPEDQGEDSASGRVSTRRGSGAPRPRIDNPEALLRPPPPPGRKRSSSVSDITPGTATGTGNRVQWMIDAIQPRLQAWVEEFLAEELPPLAYVCLNRAVPDAVDAQLRRAIPPILDELIAPLMRKEVVAALATTGDASPTGTALKGAISSAVADRLATTFPTDAGVSAPTLRDSTAPDPTFVHADPIGAAPGFGNMAPHPEGKPIYLPAFHGATGGPTDNGPPALADTASPRGTENRLGRLATEKREPYRSSRRSAPGAQDTDSEGTENPSDAEDHTRRHRTTRKYRDGRRRRNRDAGGSPSDDSSDSDHSRRRDRRSRRANRRDRRRHDLSETDYSTSDSDGEDRREGRIRRTARTRDARLPRVIRPLNDLFTKAVNYKTYRLDRRSARYDSSVAWRVNRYRKKLDVQMKTHTFSGQDPIAVLGFLARFKMACDHNGISEGAAVWCFQFYLTGQAHALLQSRLHGNTMAVDAEQRELLETYPEVVNYLLRTYATDEVISEAVGDVTSFRQSSNMTEEVYSNHLWDKALRCGTVFSDRRLKSLFVEGLLPATCAQVRNYLASHPSVDYQAVARFAQAIGETHRSARRQATPLASPQVPSDSARRFARTARTRPVLSVESLSDIPTAGGTGTEEILAVTDQSVTPSSLCSPPTSYHPSPTSSTAGAQTAPAPQSDVRAYPYGRTVQNPRVRFSNPGLPGPPPCRFCLDLTHRQEQCPVVADSALRAKLLEAREANYQKLRIRQGLRPGSPFERQPPTAWRNTRTQAPARINVVEPRAEDSRTEEDPQPLAEGGPEDLTLTGEAGEDA